MRKKKKTQKGKERLRGNRKFCRERRDKLICTGGERKGKAPRGNLSREKILRSKRKGSGLQGRKV